MLKRNKGFTIVEVIMVISCLSLVTLFFWSILSSSSEDSYTLTEKVEVQTNVTALMNQIEKDVQEAEIYSVSASSAGIMEEVDATTFKFKNIEYSFDKENRVVTRTEELEDGSEMLIYGDITELDMENVTGNKYGVKVEIVGAKVIIENPDEPANYEVVDKTKYSLNSTYYTRNTL